MKDLLLRARVVVRTSNMKQLRQRIVLKCVPHVQHDYFSSFNQSNNWFVAFSLPLLSSFVKLPFKKTTTATATATSQVNNMICWMSKTNCAARAASTLLQYLTLSAKWQHKISKVKVLNLRRYRGWKIYRCVFTLSSNLNFGNSTLLLGRLRKRTVLECVPHVQHDYSSSLNQSYHCFLAFSLPSWSLL